MMKAVLRMAAVAAFLLGGAASAPATMLVGSLSLETTTLKADRIVLGKAVEVRVGKDDAGLPATWITFEIERTLKGRAGQRVTIKQLGNCDATSNDLVARIPDLPRYTSGEEVVVFLRRDSARGFTSPVGFEGGVYRVAPDGGRHVARNGTGGAATDLERLLERVAELVAARPSK